MGKTKEMINQNEYSEEELMEQIHLKMSVEHQYYVDIYEKSIQGDKLKENEDKN